MTRKAVSHAVTAFLILGLMAPVVQAQTPDIIESVSPASANQGESFKLTITLQDPGNPPLPPSEVIPDSVRIGNLEGTNISRTDLVVTADFTIPADESVGTKDVSLEFAAPPEQPDLEPLISTKSGAFEVLSSGETGSLQVTIKPAEAVTAGAQWKADSGSWQNSGTTLSDLTVGTHTVSFSGVSGWNAPGSQTVSVTSGGTASVTGTYTEAATPDAAYPVTDTDQTTCYNASSDMTCPGSGDAFYGQDAQYTGTVPNFTDNGNGTVSDNNTGLTWQQSPDTNGDGDIDAADKLTWTEIQAYPDTLNSQKFAGYSDWRVPSIKELYSLIEFSGTDPSGETSTDTSGLTPFIDTNYFDFAYGDTDAGERVIDAQYASDTLYVADGGTLFGVNFADGRIKGYGLSLHGSDKTFFLICVRGNESYGVNSFKDNGDGTITDQAAGLMWSQSDSGTGMIWEEALAWVAQKNTENYLGYDDWRMPNAKELQSIVDYTRSPDTSSSAAIDEIFSATSITNEAGQTDYPFYWTGTTHASSNGMGGSAAYVAFGRAMGYMDETWVDVHGAGAQRSDPKTGNPDDYPTGNGPQGDAIRIYNYVRCVRDAETSSGDTCAVTLEDAVIVLKILTGKSDAKLDEDVQLCVDVNNEGKIGIEDIIYILRKVAGLI